MKRSLRARRRIHKTSGIYEVDDPNAGRAQKLSVPAGTDAIAPYQYCRVYEQRQILPEMRLMLAILDDAVAEFRRHGSRRDGKGEKHFREVEAWDSRQRPKAILLLRAHLRGPGI